jgi:molybdate transport system substrate-binding protein
MENKIRVLSISFMLFMVFSSCAPAPTKKELLIYCGITMIRPMREIADVIEEQENIKVIIIKGGSGNLLRSIEINDVGDLYLPGSASYIENAKEKDLIVETELVGYNRTALMVQKGNPLHLDNSLLNLLNPAYSVVIGNPDSGSIGKETRRILQERGIYDAVLQNTRELTTDSKDLVLALVDKRADLVINWYAVSTWDENVIYMDVIPINAELAPPKKLILASLTTAKEPELARIFMDYAISEEGQAFFQKYGFGSME